MTSHNAQFPLAEACVAWVKKSFAPTKPVQMDPIAFALGEEDARQGVMRNPYPVGSMLYRAYEEGFEYEDWCHFNAW